MTVELENRSVKRDVIYTLSLLSALLVLWELLSVVTRNPKTFPSLQIVFTDSLRQFALFKDDRFPNYAGGLQVIFINLLITLKRIFLGGSAGWLLGLLAGVFTARSTTMKRTIIAVQAFLRYIPLLALIPLFLHWFGDSELGMVIYMAFSVGVIAASDTYSAVSNVPSIWIKQARLLKANTFQEISTVIIPAIKPELAASLRNVTGLLWAFSLGAEYLTNRGGLGYLVYQSYLFADMGKLVLLSLLYLILGIITYSFLSSLIYKQTNWLNRLP